MDMPQGWVAIDLRVLPKDPKPYLVQVPRVPCVGEMFTGPDDPEQRETFFVTSVRYVYERGFYFPPTRIVVEVGLEP